MKTVVITKMSTGATTSTGFATEKDAYDYFATWCDAHGYDYEANSTEAGGIGYDYKIEII